MNRRPNRGAVPRRPSVGGGLYRDQRRTPDRRQVIVGAGAVGVFALLVLLLFNWCSGAGCDKYYCSSSKDIKAPDGFERVSNIYELNKSKAAASANTGIQVQLPLSKPTTDGRNLSFYRYIASSGAWEPITPAVLDGPGKQVSATFNETPELMAVMRRNSAAGNVVAYLAHNATLNKDAVGRVTILHTLDFQPASDGTLSGDLSTIKGEGAVALYPSVSAAIRLRGTIPIVAGILSNAQSRSNHVQQIVKRVNDLQLKGIDIAYLDLPADNRSSFALFVAELAGSLHGQGKMLTLTVPAPLKAQDRIDEGAYDWAELGKAADVLQIAPYRDQSTYRTAMPEILQHLADVVTPSKLVLTVTPLGTVKGPDGITPISLADAMSIATKLQIRVGTDQKLTTNSNVEVVGYNIDKNESLSGITWQPETATVAFTYKQDGGRTVWIENFFSIGFKLEFISRFKLGGVAVEDASDNILLGNIWPALVPFIASGQPILMQPNPADLIPRWKASKGTLDGGQRGLVKWNTPAEPGNYTVNLTLSDGVSLFENEIAVNVQPKDNAPRTANPPATAN